MTNALTDTPVPVETTKPRRGRKPKAPVTPEGATPVVSAPVEVTPVTQVTEIPASSAAVSSISQETESQTPAVAPTPTVKTPQSSVLQTMFAKAKMQSIQDAADKKTQAPKASVTQASQSPSQQPQADSRKFRSVPVQPLRKKHNSDQGSSSQNNSRQSSYHEQQAPVATIEGILDTSRDGHGVLRVSLMGNEDGDAYISTAQIRRYRIRPGDVVSGTVREAKENERYRGLITVETINGKPAEEAQKADRLKYYKLTPVYPDTQIKLEIGDEPLSNRIIDLVAPIGKGQRSLIVSPPKAGKTTLMKDIATGVAINHPEIHIMAVLIGERPEEVTEIRRHIDRLTKGVGEVAASNFDEPADEQCRIAELALEKAKRMVEMGRDVLILLDSITRLARAYNLSIPTSGRTLSGGYDPAALFPPKKFFGAARNFEVPGSLTIVGTALVETGSRMDDLIYEEFKGTGNQEVHLDRRLAERRIYPAIKIGPSGTREDHRMIDPMTYQSIVTLHRMLDMLDGEERSATLNDQLRRTKTNADFLATLKGG